MMKVMGKIKKFFIFIFGVLAGWCVLGIAGFLFLELGGMPVRTKGPPLPFERFIAHTSLHAALRADADKPSPVEANEITLTAGAKLYKHECAVCHGLPNQAATAIAAGMFPRPPQLFKHRVDDDPVGETFWKVKNGIRLTGMPGFEEHYSDTELWQVSLLLSKGDDIPESVKALLSAD